MLLSTIRRWFAVAVMSLLLVIMSLPLAMAPSVALAQGTYISVNPTSGPPGAQVTASGGGFPANVTVQIWFDQTDTGARATTDSQGNFKTNFNVPSNATPGLHPVYATDGRENASTPFTVSTVAVQKVWTADGNNSAKTSFVPGDTIRYVVQVKNWGSSTVTATFTFRATGPLQIFYWSGSGSVATGTPTFYSPSTVPGNAPAGKYTLTVTVTYNGVSSSGQSTFTVATVKVQKVWTANGNNNARTYFGPGDTIHYIAQVKNFNSTTVTATFTFVASGPQQIFYWSGSGSVATGTPTFYSPSTVPTGAPLGTYTLKVTVTYNGVSSSGQSQFTVVSDKVAHAIDWAESQLGSQNWNGLCEKFVENAYGTSGQYPTAQDAYNKLHTSTNWSPNIGALVWFAPNASNGNAGHIGIYIGQNQFISATYNGVQINDMTSWSNNIAPYEGWGNAPSSWPGR